MATCMYCNSQIQDGLKFCTNCGAALPVEAPVEVQAEVLPQQPFAGANPQQPFQQPGQQGYQQPGYQQPSAQQQQPAAYDSGSIWWGVLGFLIPIVGVVLYFVWRTSKPNSAKVAGIGAIIGFCLNLVLNFGVLMS